MQLQNYLKAGVIGLLGSLVIFVVMLLGIHVTGIAPFNMPPSAAFLNALELPTQPLALIIHFAYGFLWAAIAYGVFKDRLDLWRATGIAVVVQWLILMQLVFSPLIGWGVFGINAGELPADNPMALTSTVKYVVLTLVLHIVYGLLNGWLVPKWTK